MAILELSSLNLIIRLLISAICGIIIGYERKRKFKEAGIKTHTIVGLGACLIMMISKYGFVDMSGTYDSARIAAQIVSGIGFLGAGMIFVKDDSVSGLTTAAGIWTTAGVGMAIGSGLILLGIISSVLLVLIQIMSRLVDRYHSKELIIENYKIEMEDCAESLVSLLVFEDNIKISNMILERPTKSTLSIEMCVLFQDKKSKLIWLDRISGFKYVKKLEFK